LLKRTPFHCTLSFKASPAASLSEYERSAKVFSDKTAAIDAREVSFYRSCTYKIKSLSAQECFYPVMVLKESRRKKSLRLLFNSENVFKTKFSPLNHLRRREMERE